MKTASLRRPLRLLASLAACHFVAQVDSFSIDATAPHRSGPIRRQITEEEFSSTRRYAATTFETPDAARPFERSSRGSSSPSQQQDLSWITLPSKTLRIKEPSALDQLEILVGRVAMIGACGIVAKELFTGASILDQCNEAFQQCASYF